MESLGILNFPLVFKFPTDKNLHSMHLQRDLVGISCGHSSTRDEEASPKFASTQISCKPRRRKKYTKVFHGGAFHEVDHNLQWLIFLSTNELYMRGAKLSAWPSHTIRRIFSNVSLTATNCKEFETFRIVGEVAAYLLTTAGRFLSIQ